MSHIVVICSSPVGSTFVVREAVALRRRGHQVTLILPAAGELSVMAEREGIPVRLFALRSSLSSGNFLVKRWIDVAGVLALARWLKQVHPDTVHLHLLRARVLGRLAARLANVPRIVSHIHGIDIANPFWRLCEKATARIDTITLAVSAYVADHYTRHGGSYRRLRVHYNGVDLAAFDRVPSGREAVRAEFGVTADTPLVGLVGYMYPRVKGHEVFIQSIALLKREGVAVQAVVVGDELFGDGTYRASLEGLCRSLGVTDRIHFAGKRGDVPQVMDALDILCLPSTYPEGFGFVLVEAMARCRPVVAARLGAIPEVVEDGESGMLVPTGDIAACAAAIRQLCLAEGERARLGRRGRQIVVERFDADQLYDRLTQVLTHGAPEEGSR